MANALGLELKTVRAQVAAEAIVKQAHELGVGLFGFLTWLPDCTHARRPMSTPVGGNNRRQCRLIGRWQGRLPR